MLGGHVIWERRDRARALAAWNEGDFDGWLGETFASEALALEAGGLRE